MKTTLLASLLCIATIGVYAQSTDQPVTTNNAVCKAFPNMPAGARPVFPKAAYTPLEDPSCAPCYEYTRKSGLVVMECPYLRFPPEHGNQEEALYVPENKTNVDLSATNNAIDVQAQNTYTGNYPKVCLRDPDMPANAKPVFPTGAYTPLEDPSCAPCYEYRRKSGLVVMECPFLRFPPEHNQ